MGLYTCRLVTSWIMFSVAFVLLFMGLILRGWGSVSTLGTQFTFGLIATASYDSNEYSDISYDSYVIANDYSAAMIGTLATAIALCGICLLLSFVMMCADCCCRITQCMTVIPKITMTFAMLAGALVEVCCVLFLIAVYVKSPYIETWSITTSYSLTVLPSYCFYIVGVTGIWLMAAGCTNFGARNATQVGDDGQAEQITAGVAMAGIHGQAMGAVQPYGYNNAMPVSGYFPQAAAMGGQMQAYLHPAAYGSEQMQRYARPPTHFGFYPPETPFLPNRLILAETATQTSTVDIKEVVKKSGEA